MANVVNIVATKFENVTDGKTSLGFRAYDDYGSTYGNTLESIPDDDLEFLQAVCEDAMTDETLSSMFGDSVRDSNTPLLINGTEYKWDDIKDIVGTWM